jgi:CcmD family protein
MQADPARPLDPTLRDAGVPKALDKAAIPEMGIAGAANPAQDPGLMPGLRQPDPTRALDAPPPVPTSPEERSTEFVAVEGGRETTSAEALLVTAYVVMWGIILIFLLFTWRRQTGLERRLGDLERSLDRAEPHPPNAA